MELHMINIIYAALPMCTKTEKTTFSYKESAKNLLDIILICSIT